jgi:hypothetical protein
LAQLREAMGTLGAPPHTKEWAAREFEQRRAFGSDGERPANGMNAN